jgi:hypothetical protein
LRFVNQLLVYACDKEKNNCENNSFSKLKY